MAKNVSAIVSGAGLVAGVWTEINKAVRERGGTDDDIHRLATPDGASLIGKFADLIVANTKAAVNDFSILVDYTHSLAQMIAAGKYDWVNSDITDQHFPPPSIPTGLPPSTGSGQATKAELKVELVHFNRTISSNDAIAELKQKGLRPATIHELLAFGSTYPEEQRKYMIVALSSVWRYWDVNRGVPYLFSVGGRRRLSLGSFGGDWDAGDRFLAVCES